jgi:hypothetical protein
MRKNIFFALAALVTASLACTIGTPAPTQTPVVIVVTATEEAAVPPTDVPTEPPAPVPPTATTPPTATVIVDTPTPELLRFYVSGTVWHDLCNPPMQGVPPSTPPGCVDLAGGGYSANGIYEGGEPGLAGVTVWLEIDCSYGAFSTQSDANGNFEMTFTVPANAGIDEARICLSIDALNDGNVDILIPGGWTYPSTGGTALYDVVIPVETPNIFNFGWDFQFQ